MKGKSQTVRVAQIGCGAFAAGQDMPNYARNPDVTCQWCCDISLERAQALADRFGVPQVTCDYRDVIHDPTVDVIKIATSHETHVPLIEAAAAAGKHIFCEKPLAMETEDALRAVGAVQRSGVKLCVDLNRRMSPALNALRNRWQQHLQNPQHHPWRYIETERPLYPEEKRTQLLIRIQDDSMSYRTVHLDPLRGGGEIIGESVHWMDVACWWFAPQFPVEIQAWGSTRFSHGIHLTFSEGDTATLVFNCGGTFDYPKEQYEVMAQGALLRSDNFVENQYFGIPGLEREIFPLQHDPLPEVGSEGGLSGLIKKSQARVASLSNSKEGHEALAVDKGHQAMLDGFVRAIIDDTTSPCDEMAGYRSTLLARLAIQSIELRQALPVLRERVEFMVV
jgi:predicted dehydrogenase